MGHTLRCGAYAKDGYLETGSSAAALPERSVLVGGLARLVRSGTRPTFVWSVADDEQRFFNGATYDRDANAATLARLARVLGRPAAAWVTRNRHGVDFWRYGVGMVNGRNPGRPVVFTPTGHIPPGAICT